MLNARSLQRFGTAPILRTIVAAIGYIAAASAIFRAMLVQRTIAAAMCYIATTSTVLRTTLVQRTIAAAMGYIPTASADFIQRSSYGGD